MGFAGCGAMFWHGAVVWFSRQADGFGALGSGLGSRPREGIDRPGGFLSFLFNGEGLARAGGDRVFDNWIWRKRSVDGGVVRRALAMSECCWRDFGGSRFEVTDAGSAGCLWMAVLDWCL